MSCVIILGASSCSPIENYVLPSSGTSSSMDDRQHMSIICIKCGTSKDDIDANGDNSCDHIWKRQATKIDDLNNIIFVENRTTEHIILNIKWNESASDTMSNFAIPNHVYERVAHYPYVHICSNEVVVYPKNACYTNGYVVAFTAVRFNFCRYWF